MARIGLLGIKSAPKAVEKEKVMDRTKASKANEG